MPSPGITERYQVVSAPNPLLLAQAVGALLQAGWSLQAGVSVALTVLPALPPPAGSKKAPAPPELIYTYAQALIRA